MGKKWISAVKKIFNFESKETHTSEKLKKKSKDSRKNSLDHLEDSRNGSYSMKMAAAAAAEAAMAAARAAAEVARLTTSLRAIHGGSREVAAIKIQAAFRGYLVRKGTGTLRGLVKLKLMAGRMAVKRQTMETLHRMQALARIQQQIRERKFRLSEENLTLHKQRQLKRDKELEKSKMGEDWVDSPHSKEQFEAKLQKKQEAALRRERTLAYAYSHQWRSNSARHKKPAFMDPTKQHWAWSWSERWQAARPWEISQTSNISDKEYRSNTTDKSSIRSAFLDKKASSRGLFGFQSEQHRRRHSLGSSLCFESRVTKSRFQAKKPLLSNSAARKAW